MNSVSFFIPDFVDQDGTVYSEIEIIVQSNDGDIQNAVRLAGNVRASTEC